MSWKKAPSCETVIQEVPEHSIPNSHLLSTVFFFAVGVQGLKGEGRNTPEITVEHPYFIWTNEWSPATVHHSQYHHALAMWQVRCCGVQVIRLVATRPQYQYVFDVFFVCVF